MRISFKFVYDIMNIGPRGRSKGNVDALSDLSNYKSINTSNIDETDWLLMTTKIVNESIRTVQRLFAGSGFLGLHLCVVLLRFRGGRFRVGEC